jgi:geranylgeranyl diphosphate synthase type II
LQQDAPLSLAFVDAIALSSLYCCDHRDPQKSPRHDSTPFPLARFGHIFYNSLRMSVTSSVARAVNDLNGSPSEAFQARLSEYTHAVNRALDRFLPSETTKPATIHKAMRYSLFAGGKRIRPALCLAAAEACGGSIRDALPLACAVECIHTYSLIHDDLPAMDNDDFRRGKPTNHKVFGQGMAILAGDALLTIAFEIAAKSEGWSRYSHQKIVVELASGAGSLELIAGQVADLESEGKSIPAKELQYIHERKTSALLRCSARLGGMSANCSPAQLKALSKFGYNVGLAFQVIDDILDVTQTTDKLGKTAGKDTKAKKATYPSIIGLEKSRKVAQQLTARAFESVELFGRRGAALRDLADLLLSRDR